MIDNRYTFAFYNVESRGEEDPERTTSGMEIIRPDNSAFGLRLLIGCHSYIMRLHPLIPWVSYIFFTFNHSNHD
jgi:hypothetical protein